MSMNDQLEHVASAIEPLRQSLQLDGADVAIVQIDGATVELSLDVSNASCKDCVLPQDILEQTLLLTIRKKVPGIATVKVHDPRTEDPELAGDHA
ncbi:MAG: NifU family protein [Acidimicrobiales bacterium]